ncbi:MAG: hypothetical protein HC875_40940 [Anaerolineales bacterium]|nr:hypothetical protein [Anaerolineales bacterium]
MENDWNPDDPWEVAANPKSYLQGSPSRDAFKHWHKSLGKDLIATDLDFVLVSDSGLAPGIIAVLDYKRPEDKLSFTEIIAYNQLVEFGIPIYVIVAEYLDGKLSEKFTIRQYFTGNPRKLEDVQLSEPILMNASRDEYERWERRIRLEYKHSLTQLEYARKRVEAANNRYRLIASAIGKALPTEFWKWDELLKKESGKNTNRS